MQHTIEKNIIQNTLYTVRKIKRNFAHQDKIIFDEYELSKTIHGSKDGIKTVCGYDLYIGDWYIWNNTFDGVINCKKCLDLMKRDSE